MTTQKDPITGPFYKGYQLPFLLILFGISSLLLTDNLGQPLSNHTNPSKAKLAKPVFSKYIDENIRTNACTALMHIEAEDYNNSYSVRKEICSDFGGGYNLTRLSNKSKSYYNVHVPVDGIYRIYLRIASESSSGTASIFQNEAKIAQISIPQTGGWQRWETIRVFTPLKAGDQILSIEYAGPKGNLLNLNWIEMECMEFPTLTTSSQEEFSPELLPVFEGKNTLFISLPENAVEPLWFEIFDLQKEKIVVEQKVAQKPIQPFIEVNKKNLDIGIYLFVLKSPTQFFSERMLISF